MRPERNAVRVLSTTRAKAKMYEYVVPEEDHLKFPVSPDVLFSLAVGLVGDAAAAIASEPRDADPRATSSEALNFAATFFDAYIDAKLNEDVRNEFALLAAASYFLADMPGNARVLATRIAPPRYPGAATLDWLSFKLLRGEYEVDLETLFATGDLLGSFQGYLVGDVEANTVLSAARELRSDAYKFGEPRAVLYADIAVAILKKKIENASRTQLPLASELPLDQWLATLRKPNFILELWPAQRRICDAGLLAGKPGIVQMPTSAGKTRATELIIRSAFLAERTSLAVVVAPFRALCHDIRGDLARVFQGENIAINEATDSYQLDLTIDELWERKTVLIVTPEKLLYILRRAPEVGQQVGLMIYDEGHQFDSPSRGATYELLLTTVKLLLPEGSQTVLVSAVISNAPAVADWLFGDASATVDGKGLSPTARSIAFANWTTKLGQLQYVAPTTPDDVEFFVPRVIESTRLGRLGRERKDRFFPSSEDGISIGLYLGLKVVTNGSVAIFCGRKDSAAKVCDLAVELRRRGFDTSSPLHLADEDEVEKIAALFERELGASAGATLAARIGVFPHHGNVPHGLRISVEHAMKEGLIRFVVCTSTLAQGVNLPIRYLIVTSVYQGGDQIKVRDFHNLIGRAGRAGMHTEGSIIFAQNEVFDGRRKFDEQWRWNAAKRLLDPANSEPCASAILSLFEPFEYHRNAPALRLDPENLHTLAFADAAAIDQGARTLLRGRPLGDEAEFRRYLQSIARILHSISAFILAHLDFELETLPEDAELLGSYTLAHHLADLEQRVALQTVFRNLAAYLLENAPTPELRMSMRRSPLSPVSVRELSDWVSDNLGMLREAAAEESLLTALSEQMLRHTTDKTILGLSDKNAAIEAGHLWLAGQSFADIHAQLYVDGVTLGVKRPRQLKIEDIVELCENSLGYDCSMFVATIADLVEPLDEDLSEALSHFQRRFKYGLTSEAAVAFYELGFSDRVVSEALAEAFPNVTTRTTARTAIVRGQDRAEPLLGQFPSYFRAVLSELVG